MMVCCGKRCAFKRYPNDQSDLHRICTSISKRAPRFEGKSVNYRRQWDKGVTEIHFLIVLGGCQVQNAKKPVFKIPSTLCNEKNPKLNLTGVTSQLLRRKQAGEAPCVG